MEDYKERSCYESIQEGPDDSISLDAIFDEFGFGRFQFFIIIVCGILWLSDGMEMMLLSILGPILQCEWHLIPWQEAFVTTAVFAGILIGSPFFGWFSDVYGRKLGLVFSASWVLFYGVLCAIAPNIEWFIFLRFSLGFGIGSLPLATTYAVEFLPTNLRARGIQGINGICDALD